MLSDLPLSVLQTILLLLPLESRVTVRAVSRWFQSLVDDLLARETRLFFSLKDEDVEEYTLHHHWIRTDEDAPLCECRDGLRFEYCFKKLSCLESRDQAWLTRLIRLKERIRSATVFAAKHLKHVTSIHADRHWLQANFNNDASETPALALIRKHRDTLRCLRVTNRDDSTVLDFYTIDDCFPQLRYLSCRCILPPIVLFRHAAPKAESVTFDFESPDGESLTAEEALFHLKDVPSRVRGIVMRWKAVTPQQLLKSPVAQSIEMIDSLYFPTASRFSGHFPRLHTLVAKCYSYSEWDNYERGSHEDVRQQSLQPDTSGISEFLDAHAGRLRYLKLTSGAGMLSPKRQMNCMRTLILRSTITPANVVLLLECMPFLRTLEVHRLHFADADLLLQKLSSMSCLEEVSLWIRRWVPRPPEARMLQSILAFLTGNSMTRLRTVRLGDTNKISYEEHEALCYVPLTREAMQQVERMTMQHSLQSAEFCYMSLSRSSAEAEGFQWDRRDYGWDKMLRINHRVLGSRALEQQVCLDCHKHFSPPITPPTDS